MQTAIPVDCLSDADDSLEDRYWGRFYTGQMMFWFIMICGLVGHVVTAGAGDRPFLKDIGGKGSTAMAIVGTAYNSL